MQEYKQVWQKNNCWFLKLVESNSWSYPYSIWDEPIVKSFDSKLLIILLYLIGGRTSHSECENRIASHSKSAIFASHRTPHSNLKFHRTPHSECDFRTQNRTQSAIFECGNPFFQSCFFEKKLKNWLRVVETLIFFRGFIPKRWLSILEQIPMKKRIFL